MAERLDNIELGMTIGRIVVGELVRNVQEHSLFLETPTSYLKQGRLREILCACGTIRLVAESILLTGRIQSCGCLRREIRAGSTEKKIARMSRMKEKKNLTAEIQIDQLRLKQLKAAYLPDEAAIAQLQTKIRSAFQKRGILASQAKLERTPKVK